MAVLLCFETRVSYPNGLLKNQKIARFVSFCFDVCSREHRCPPVPSPRLPIPNMDISDNHLLVEGGENQRRSRTFLLVLLEGMEIPVREGEGKGG